MVPLARLSAWVLQTWVPALYSYRSYKSQDEKGLKKWLAFFICTLPFQMLEHMPLLNVLSQIYYVTLVKLVVLAWMIAPQTEVGI